MIITHYFIKKEIKGVRQQTVGRAHRYQSLDEIRTVLLLFDAKNLSEVQPCIRQLENRKIKVSACAYTKEEMPNWPASILLIREKKDVNKLGIPVAAIEEKFNSIQADLLIDLTETQSYSMRLLMLKHPSLFKVGAKSEGLEQLHDLSIAVTNKNSIGYLFEQILFYLQAIRSK